VPTWTFLKKNSYNYLPSMKKITGPIMARCIFAGSIGEKGLGEGSNGVNWSRKNTGKWLDREHYSRITEQYF